MKRTFSLLLTGAFALLLLHVPASAAQGRLSATDAGEISTSYTYLTDNFYQKVEPQIVLDSVRTQLLAAMRTAGVKHASLPAMHATRAPADNVRAIDHEIEDAAAESKQVHAARSELRRARRHHALASTTVTPSS